MNIYKITKKITCFILLYTILILNTSLFYTFATELENTETTTTDNKAPDDAQDIQNDNIPPKVEDKLGLNSKCAVLMDAKTGLILYDKNKDFKSYPASTTKILTALLAIENTKPTDILTHSHNAIYNIGPGSSHIGMREKEQITMDDALYGVLLASANEVCMAIGEKVSGNVDAFVDLMNKRAQQIGAKNTHFANPHGFHDPNHYTTAYDLALIMQQAIKNPDFVKYISTPRHTIPETNIVNEKRMLNNSNKLILTTSPFYYQYCVGGKTGFTDEAGHTLVSYAKKGDIELIAVVMQAEGTNSYTDSIKLFEFGFSDYDNVEIFQKDSYKNKTLAYQTFKDKEIDLGNITMSAQSNLSVNIPKNVDIQKIERVCTVPTKVKAPIKEGDNLGSLDFIYDGKKIGSVDLYAENTIMPISEAKLQLKEDILLGLKILKYVIIAIVVIIILIFILRAILKSINRKKRRKYYYNNKPLKPMKKRKRR